MYTLLLIVIEQLFDVTIFFFVCCGSISRIVCFVSLNQSFIMHWNFIYFPIQSYQIVSTEIRFVQLCVDLGHLACDSWQGLRCHQVPRRASGRR
jgi:hypothetical protein